MNAEGKNPAAEIPKALTGIAGFDEITCGGIPRGKVSIVTGRPGSGKTVFALQTLANAAIRWKEPGIFVTFEENSRQIIAEGARFGWNLAELEELFFLDAMPDPETISLPEFDFSQMLAVLSEKVKAMKARRIVFDSLDVLLQLLLGPEEKQREMNRLHDWLIANDLTALMTAKLDWQRGYTSPLEEGCLLYLPSFVFKCVIVLTHQFKWPRKFWPIRGNLLA